MFIIIPGAFNAQVGVPGGTQQGQVVTVGSILKVIERDRRPYPTDVGTPSEIWIDNTAGIGYICKEFDTGHGTVWDRLDLLGDFVTFGDSDPGVNIDIKLGYRPGSLRYARNSEILWICKDNTQGAAVWDVLSSGGGVVSVNGLTGVVQLYLDDILDVDAATPNDGDVLTWDSASSTWIAATGGGGTYTVDNGLTESPANNFQLGGTLIQDTTINTGIYEMVFSGIRPYGSATSEFYNLDQGQAIYAESIEDVAIVGYSNQDSGGYFSSDEGTPISGAILDSPNNNTVLPLIGLSRKTLGSAANGIGGSIQFRTETSTNVLRNSLDIKNYWTNVIDANRTSAFELWLANGGTNARKLLLAGSGQLTLDNYTGTTFDASPFKSLGVDASGNVITFTGGGGGTVTGVTATLPITSSGGAAPVISTSMATNKLIGRGTAGTGVMEEITLGTNLSLSGTTLNASGGGNSIGQLTGDVDTVLATSSTQVMPSTLKANLKKGSFGVTVDGISSVIQVGQTGFVTLPYAGTITGWSITTNAPGSIQFDVWKAAAIDTIPTSGDSIVGGVYPTLTTAQLATSTSVGAWTTAFSAGHVFGFYVNSVSSTFKNATLTIRTTKT